MMHEPTRLHHMLRALLVHDRASLSHFEQRWDDLARGADMPYAAPAWLLPWFEHVAHADARLRVVMVLEDEDLVAVAPFFVDRGFGGVIRYRLLGSARRDVLCAPRREADAMRAVAGTLVQLDTRPDVFMLESVPRSSEWPALLAQRWPGGLSRYQQYEQPAPAIDLRGSTFDGWFAAKSRNFRQGMRRKRRHLEAANGSIRLVRTADESIAAWTSSSDCTTCAGVLEEARPR